MLTLLRKQTKVLDKTDDIVEDIKNEINSKYSSTLTNEEIVNIISSQSYLAFKLGVCNELDVRFPRLGTFRINANKKKAGKLYQLVLAECNNDKVLAKATFKRITEQHVFKDIQV